MKEFTITDNKIKNTTNIVVESPEQYQVFEMDTELFNFIFEAFLKADEETRMKVLENWAKDITYEMFEEEPNIKEELEKIQEEEYKKFLESVSFE